MVQFVHGLGAMHSTHATRQCFACYACYEGVIQGSWYGERGMLTCTATEEACLFMHPVSQLAGMACTEHMMY